MACIPIDSRSTGIARCPQCSLLFMYGTSDIQEVKTVGTETVNGKEYRVLGGNVVRAVKCPRCGLFVDSHFVLSGNDFYSIPEERTIL